MPKSAILLVGNIFKKQFVENGVIALSKTFMPSLTCNHNTIDRAQVTQLLHTLQQYIEPSTCP
ncbi:2-oxo acid dehydrogenase subunit E2 [Flavobacterium sp. ACAM 123]|uniref:2-oxo acid dehydrogenase subunit E2 n=1 Tax=Flavobacterium sp. ACAM 123 TaxID=1189620 RepID=UPI0003717D54